MTQPNLESLAREREELTEAQVDALWSRIEKRLDDPSPTASRAKAGALGRKLAVAALLAAAVTGSLFGGHLISSVSRHFSGHEASLSAGAEILTNSDALKVGLTDGSKLELLPGSRLSMVRSDEQQVELSLSEGSVECQVSKNPNRLFSVKAGVVTVRVIGTKFRVSRASAKGRDAVEVRVLEGVVEVSRSDRPGSATQLHAGESWGSGVSLSDTAPRSEAPVVAEPRVLPDRDTRALSSEAAQGTAGTPQKSPPAPVSLFEQAGAHRRAGNIRDASTAYDEFVRTSPKDPRAALAAFESARLKMNSLGDAKGALQGFQKALELGPKASFREDALAGIVKLLARGGSSRCGVYRDEYTSEYPRGVHRAELERVCRP